MRVFILGIDGYIGWALAQYLKSKGHLVGGMDNGLKRKLLDEQGCPSIIPVESMGDRFGSFLLGDEKTFISLASAGSEYNVRRCLKSFEPDVVVNLAQLPSAPYSMQGPAECLLTQENNLKTNLASIWAIKRVCPDVHMITLGCFDSDTEIFTSNGWVPFPDLKGDELVATKDLDGGPIKFVKPKEKHVYEYTGKMYKVLGQRIDMVVTPNHRLFTLKRSNSKYGPLRCEYTNGVYGKRRTYDIGFNWVGEDKPTINICGKDIDTKIYLRYLGWFLSEGCVPKRKDRPSSYRTQLGQKSLGNEERLSVMLNDFNNFAEQIGFNAAEYYSKEDCKAIIWGKEVSQEFSKYGKSKDKYIPRDILMLNVEYLSELLDTLILGDGWKHGRGYRYFTISKQLADDIQELALKCGYAANISRRLNGYQVNICKTRRTTINNGDSQNDSWVDYSGYVYCVNVGEGPGIVLVRRNGHVHWSGNTMGEYGTPNTDIPEGDFELEFRGRKDRLQFPRIAHSLYHSSKVAASANCELVCRVWGSRITDIMQGVVYGTRAPGVGSPTMFYVDEAWGTIVNRFCAQAVVGHPLTIYGEGRQTRGMLPLRDALRCIELLMENPPEEGVYRVVNQFDQSYSINEVAQYVQRVAVELGLPTPELRNYPNPRVEKVDHYYNPDRQKLVDLGYEPEGGIVEELRGIIEDLIPHKDRIMAQMCNLAPKTKWR